MDTLEKPTYDGDFVLWLTHQAELLRQGRVAELDLENLAEEVESIGRRDKRETYNRLTVLLMHLLKYEFQPGQRTRSWHLTIREQRRQLKLVFKDSPSLAKQYVPTVLGDIYRDAKTDASDETSLPPTTFPENCPYTVKQLLDEDFFPEG